MNLLSQRDLNTKKGIAWSREHVRRMVKAGKFPAPFKLSERGRNVWAEDVIDAWIEERAAKASSSS